MNKRTFITGAFLCLLAVFFGAFGAHGLRDEIEPSSLENWKTAVQYQFFHALALLLISNISGVLRFVNIIFCLFLSGIILFSGSLYLLSTRNLTGISGSFLGPLTPLGGLLLIAGWGVAIAGALKSK